MNLQYGSGCWDMRSEQIHRHELKRSSWKMDEDVVEIDPVVGEPEDIPHPPTDFVGCPVADTRASFIDNRRRPCWEVARSASHEA
jgi:hypothetical protein